MNNDFLTGIKKGVSVFKKLKSYALNSSVESIVEWSKKISNLQIEYRKVFNSDNNIVPTCSTCSMCCMINVGVNKLTQEDLLYYSNINIDWDKYFINSPNMCLFWKAGKGCNLPANARPLACLRYVCNINDPLQSNSRLFQIREMLNDLYLNPPQLVIDPKKLPKGEV